jgi:thiamine phosphate synthase YjbQ (UPF0047 family)
MASKTNGTARTSRRDVLKALGRLRGEGWKTVGHTTRGVDEIRAHLDRQAVPPREVARIRARLLRLGYIER